MASRRTQVTAGSTGQTPGGEGVARGRAEPSSACGRSPLWLGGQAGTVMYRQEGGVLWTHGQWGGGHHGCPQRHPSQTDGRGQEGSVQGSWGGWAWQMACRTWGWGARPPSPTPWVLGLHPVDQIRGPERPQRTDEHRPQPHIVGRAPCTVPYQRWGPEMHCRVRSHKNETA